MDATERPRADSQDSSGQTREALRVLKDDPEFQRDLERLQRRVKEALVGSGIPEDRLRVGTGGQGGPDGSPSERAPGHYTCLLTLFDECWFWVKVV